MLEVSPVTGNKVFSGIVRRQEQQHCKYYCVHGRLIKALVGAAAQGTTT